MKTIISLLVLFVAVTANAQRVPLTTTELGIDVRGSSRTMLYSNRSGSEFCAQTSAGLHIPTEGWRVGGREILRDYTIRVGEKDLSRSDVVQTLVYPNQFVRKYRNGVVETVTLLDHSNTITVILDSLHGQAINVRPWFSTLHDSSELITLIRFGELVIGQEDHTAPSPTDSTPGWLGILLTPGTSFSFVFKEPATGPLGYSPASLGSGNKSDQFGIIFVATPQVSDIYNLGAQNLRTFLDSLYDRRVRLDQHMNRAYLRTGNEAIDRSIHWAQLSLDALSVDGAERVMMDGLPSSGRIDTRILLRAVTGACLVRGDFLKARDLFRFFAARQDTEKSSRTYGRIPSAVEGEYLRFDGADVTPLFVDALNRFVQQSGDTATAREFFPAVARSVEATLSAHTDSLMFLVHGGLETWMPVPRGNRAVEVQALWHRQLLAAADLARVVRDGRRADRWLASARKLKENFSARFIDPSWSAFADALRPDGKPMDEVRPNQFLARELSGDLPSYANIFSYVTRSLVYRQGVGTLSPADPDFTPFRYQAGKIGPGVGAVDGPIAQWLTGEWITQAAQMGAADSAFEVTSSLARTIVDGDVVGTLPEVFDVLPEGGGGPPRHSGALSSAAALAEYLRSWYDGYLGVTVGRLGTHLTLQPALPSSMRDVDATVYVGSSAVRVRYHFAGDTSQAVITTDSTARPFTTDLILSSHNGGDSLISITAEIQPGETKTIQYVKDVTSSIRSGQTVRRLPPATVVGRLRLADLPAASREVRPRDFPLLTIKDVGKTAGPGATVLYTAVDKTGDDIGPGHEAYPPGPGYPPGSFDLTKCTVSADSSSVYFRLTFRDLPYPHLHPDAGFDGVIAAIAIEKTPAKNPRTTIGRQARLTVPGFDASVVIYVGNGISVEDAEGKPLAEYTPVPQDEASPIGSFVARSINFSIPQSLIGRPGSKWRYAVVAGPRDDAAGDVGVFRPAVSSPDGSSSAVFDAILPERRR